MEEDHNDKYKPKNKSTAVHESYETLRSGTGDHECAAMMRLREEAFRSLRCFLFQDSMQEELAVLKPGNGTKEWFAIVLFGEIIEPTSRLHSFTLRQHEKKLEETFANLCLVSGEEQDRAKRSFLESPHSDDWRGLPRVLECFRCVADYIMREDERTAFAWREHQRVLELEETVRALKKAWSNMGQRFESGEDGT